MENFYKFRVKKIIKVFYNFNEVDTLYTIMSKS